MSDYLVRMAQQPALRSVIKTIGLPTPQTLARAGGPYVETPLAGKTVLFGAGDGATASKKVQTTLKAMGAEAQSAADVTGDSRFNAVVFDATGMTDPAQLRALYDFFHPIMRNFTGNARVVLLADVPETADSVPAAVAARAVEGFVRSLAKEIGRKGATANLVYVEKGAEDRVAGPLRFFLSDHSTYVDGQPVRVTKGGKMPRSVPVTRPLDGKVALVTGGARGIGAATAERLSQEGAHVVVLDIPADAETLETTAKAVGGTALPQDITDADAPRAIADFLKEKFGGVDIVVHNAGVTRDKMLANMAEHLWDMVLAINLRSILAIDEVLLGDKIVNDHGRILCLSSIGGIAGNAGQTNYGATKAGLIGYVQSQGQKFGDRGITVNAVAPGFIETRMTAEMPFMIREGGRRMNSMSQGGQPQDVAELLTFLATPGAGGVSGNVVRVCGQSLIGA
ncbi:3-oxoacyl-ACP reductase [Salinisphaera sp. P385]|uniref:3-oxoacyl-ACP reductase n=1 Tax=Spectribacter acetivorans TaxID=3075603 RepID=A0ABU3BDG7_9GAMM|nr:3-oxoacyl-ACP reductase [Salinisphaera sp. P385]MDT0619922.1 3-oxoacyl-ACP reductase [Salinisphaera sp. P385]